MEVLTVNVRDVWKYPRIITLGTRVGCNKLDV